ncbi:hypothetical protein [Oceanirhabdus sp. W0125-5]|uniref:hypothetical protein n=1 Tax=Oceanirhabdus sp. W0125-5 TaxID=2999116 RepID=UPI0022F302C0|nr:hypothetical protein [Oceanirhabdus sp. W0125-5]WBW99260.1 hypothetical protein OW730_11065 [Oceanirhabdus sp. W0125-5]
MEFERLSRDEFRTILDKIDYDNYANFSSLHEAVMEELNDESVYEDIVSYFEMELDYNCDANIKDLEEENIQLILETVNS